MSKSLSANDLKKVCKVPFFEGLSIDDISNLLNHSSVIETPKGRLLFSQGDVADKFYVILEGRVKLFLTNEEGEESIIEIYGAQSSFAEAAMFASARFPVNGETTSASRLIQVEGPSFLRVLQENKEMCQKITTQMARRYRSLQNEIIHLKTHSPAQRLGVFFLSLVGDAQGQDVVLPYSKNLIAARVGMKPESLSRALGRLKEIGVICEKDRLRVENLESLQAFCKD
ncbi:MAG: cyclic nucleotide-binding domain-containing protein [Methylocystaceae bacterium]|nr:cyclic nucleotide-binding domain-containing protein [Methylocystaceae bacterium]